ncbi:hypothetical protein RI129_007502 [Pyrocoelia pectoralis]|uniref:4-coumarate--CoA ligase n=1 Tax=Pyrocoelia pectoralis TaxID=417401 RepID=A0AAN7ZIJ9_9COLE
MMYRTALKLPSLKKRFTIPMQCSLYSTKSYTLRSPNQTIEIPHASIPEFLFENCCKFPHKIAMECTVTGRKYTYEELRKKSINFSRAITQKLKLRKGEVVAIFLPNVPEFPIALLAILNAGLIATTLSPLSKSEEIRQHLSDSGSKAIITTCTLFSLANTYRSLLKIPVVTIKTTKDDTTPEGSINFLELTDTSFDKDKDIIVNSTDFAMIPYSSGSTGLPKGVLHTHYSLLANLIQINTPEVKVLETATVNYQDIVPAITTFAHYYGFHTTMLNALFTMSRLVTVQNFSPDTFIKVFDKHKPTVIYVVPTIIFFIINNEMIKQSHLASLRTTYSAAAPLSALDQERLSKKSGKNLLVMQGYGTSESGIISCNQICNPRLGSVGVPVSNTEIKIVQDQGAMSDDNSKSLIKGELLVRGPQLMCGYYKRPEETTKTLVDGWLKTGDIFYYEESKNLCVVDRIKDIIKVKGYQVAPAELEDVIRGYPNVERAAVIGIPHNTYGEVPRAYITLKPKTKVNIDELNQFVASKVSNYKKIQGGIVVVEDLPANLLGKTLRRSLKSEYLKSLERINS